MTRPAAKVEKVYFYSKPVDLRKSIDDLTAFVELDIKMAVLDPVLFVFLNKPRTLYINNGMTRALADHLPMVGLGCR